MLWKSKDGFKKNNRLKISALLLFGIGLTGLQAQESINAIGEDATGSGGSVSYSIGQIAYNISTGSNSTVAQGVQQAFEISVPEVEEVGGVNISIIAYPNPTSDYLTLEVKDLELSNLNFQLFDIQGRLLQNQKIIKPNKDWNGQTYICHLFCKSKPRQKRSKNV